MQNKKVVIIGGGIAGLCSAVYARKSGYEVEVLEMGHNAGGLATSWRRGEYTFETCLHWLLGSNPSSPMYAHWQEVFDIGKLKFVDPEEMQRVENEHGESLTIYANVDRMESELLKRAPQDEAEIRRFASEIRRLARLRMPDPDEPLRTLLRSVSALPLLRQLSHVSAHDYGQRFTHPLLRSFFGEGQMAELSAIALIFSLAWMSRRDAGYAIGGSQAIIRLITENLANLGGRLRLGAQVERILVENDAAVGVQLAGGEMIAADWVISAADGHATIYELLGGKYKDRVIDKAYSSMKPFPSFLQVSLGVGRDLSDQPRFLTRVLDAPFAVDPGTELSQVSFRFFHFDPTFAPAGKTAVICFLPTRNFEYWVNLQQRNPEQYQAEKQRVAEQVIRLLENRMPGILPAIEVTDVSNAGNRHPLHGQLAGQHGRLADHSLDRFQSIAKNSSRFAAFQDGRAMGDARRRTSLRLDDCEIRDPSAVQRRSSPVLVRVKQRTARASRVIAGRNSIKRFYG